MRAGWIRRTTRSGRRFCAGSIGLRARGDFFVVRIVCRGGGGVFTGDGPDSTNMASYACTQTYISVLEPARVHIVCRGPAHLRPMCANTAGTREGRQEDWRWQCWGEGRSGLNLAPSPTEKGPSLGSAPGVSTGGGGGTRRAKRGPQLICSVRF